MVKGVCKSDFKGDTSVGLGGLPNPNPYPNPDPNPNPNPNPDANTPALRPGYRGGGGGGVRRCGGSVSGGWGVCVAQEGLGATGEALVGGSRPQTLLPCGHLAR